MAIATAPGVGAIAIVRASGPHVRALAARLFASREPLRERYATYGDVLDERGEKIDRGIAILAYAPQTYTGEDTLELQVHGSTAIAAEVVRALIACGARAAGPGEFTRRAFLHGKLDLHAAAAVGDAIAAQSRSAARAALANLGGGLANEVRVLRAILANLLEQLAASLDFPDEVPEPQRAHLATTLDELASSLQALQRDGEVGKLVREGVGVAIVGPPNAGKSSLLNALLGEERALVSEQAGTTRDTIEESIAIDGVLVRLVDTAGIRAHADRLEAAGIERTARALAGARLALIVLDGSQPVGDEGASLLERTEGRERIVFFNKADLGRSGADAHPIHGAIVGSVNDDATLAVLRAAIARAGWGGKTLDLERPHLASAWEFDAVAQALSAIDRARSTVAAGEPVDLIAGELQRAHAALGQVTGDVATEELLDGIFSRFCIGK
ncbi:MAG TPA: tRNA uridine-5-carboxymethylaminomethyl(34) synthesis GTPase MnmE [Candidatus Baltobacteraceae bacterium]